MSGSIAARLAELGLQIPAAPPPVGAYVPVKQCGHLVVTSGQLPVQGKEVVFAGKLGRELTVEQGAAAARLCTINALAQIQSLLGSLDRVSQIVRVEGFVQSAEGFTSQPLVVNGASQLLVEIFGEAGKHTRIAVGANELPLNAAVEVVVWAEVAS